MAHFQTWIKAWSLLDRSERRHAGLVLVTVVLVGILVAGMVASVFPFLAVLADREAIDRIPLLSSIYDFFAFDTPESFIVGLGFGALGLVVVATAAQILRAYAIWVFSATAAEGLGTRLLGLYVRQPYLFFLDRHSGDLQTRVLAVSHQVIDTFFRPAAEICAAAFSALAILALIFWLAPVVSFFCILTLGGIYGSTYLITRKRIAHQAKQHFAANQLRYRVTNEAFGGIKPIKVLGKEEAYIDRFRKPAGDVARAQIIIGITSEIPNYVLQALAFGGIILLALALLGAGSNDAQNNLAEVLPMIGLFAFAGQRLLPELQRIYAAFTQMQQGHVAVAALHADLSSLEPRETAGRQFQNALGLKRDLVFEDVTFTYTNADRPSLKGFSCSIKAGERVGVVGTTGAGKSTLADLTLGLIRPDSGRICADGTEITNETLRAWQKSIGYVPQDIFLVDASIKENVALGDSANEIDPARVEKACEIAQIGDFINSDLPEGFDTKIGERGVRLSGGQRQRIGIARAIYHDADLLVFDEATSALDPVTERDVIASIDALPGEITMLLIAHRLSTVANCDRILVLDQGELAAVGTWEDLLASNDLFRRLAEGHRQGSVPAANSTSV